MFSFKSTVTEEKIQHLEEVIKNKDKELQFLDYELALINGLVNELQNKLKSLEHTVEEEFGRVKMTFRPNEKFFLIINDINVDNWSNKKSKIEFELEEERNSKKIDSHLLTDYAHTPLEILQRQLEEYRQMKNKIGLFSTDERLKSVNVIACTLDGYIGRYTDKRMEVDHIFLDEAGYANIIKSLTLFNHSAPISFLGDHMQLPPVCEINDLDIQKNEAFSNMFIWSQSAIFSDSLFHNDRDTCLKQYLNNSSFSPTVISKTALTSTYRFGDNLAKILGKYVYDANFTSLNSIGETQIKFIHGTKTEPYKSRISYQEADAIESIVNTMYNDGHYDFIILTPYKKTNNIIE